MRATGSGFRYRDPDVTPDGAFDLRLKARTKTQLRPVGVGEPAHTWRWR